MDNSRRQSAQSPLSKLQLPSISSINDNVGHGSTLPRVHRESEQQSLNNVIQILQQQISARDHNIDMLRSEHERTQSRYEALEMKSRVMDHEVAVLTEERTELRKRVNSLTNQVEKLGRDREELQNQSQADAVQWRQIMSMSSRLQMQSVEESRQFNAEREAWVRERERLEYRILELSGEEVQRVDTGDSSSSTSEVRRALTVTSMSDDQLRQEVAGLRERCKELEGLLSAVVKECASIERAGVLIKEVKRRIMSTENQGEEETSSAGDE